MPNAKVATNEQIITAYRETCSIWKAAKRLGLCGQSVHERLKTLGVPIVGMKMWTPEEDEELRKLIAEQMPIGEVSRRLGRTFAGTACRMNELKITSQSPRAKKIPRGAGFDKATTLRCIKEIELSGQSVLKYARAHGKNVDTMVLAFQTHCPERWDEHVARTSDIPKKECAYCKAAFFPITGKQVYCSRRCASTARGDRNYFGGNRPNTIGLAEKTCQLCERHIESYLASHHVIGKENDPENASLIALCRGCHKIITMLATRSFLDKESTWENLITLAILRRDGPKIAKGEKDGKALSVCVDIDIDDEADDEEEYEGPHAA